MAKPYYHPARVVWIIWCGLWAAAWLFFAGLNIPHHACLRSMYFLNGTTQCLRYGTAGSGGIMLLFLVLAIFSAAAAFIPVGPPRSDD